MKRILTLLRHWREAKSAFSTLSHLYASGDTSLDALGGLTDEEIRALIAWLPEEGNFVEVGTLFGLTARAIRNAHPRLTITTVDNFSWNPFGLPPRIHEQFTRHILADANVTLVNCSSDEWRRTATKIDAIFFDASHRYEDVLEECRWAKEQNIALIMGHDYNNANPRFGVTRAVNEVFGADHIESRGLCWRVR